MSTGGELCKERVSPDFWFKTACPSPRKALWGSEASLSNMLGTAGMFLLIPPAFPDTNSTSQKHSVSEKQLFPMALARHPATP